MPRNRLEDSPAQIRVPVFRDGPSDKKRDLVGPTGRQTQFREHGHGVDTLESPCGHNPRTATPVSDAVTISSGNLTWGFFGTVARHGH